MKKMILNYDRSTPNKIRYSTLLDKHKFHIYVAKWRVPDEVPQQIEIVVAAKGDLPEKYKALTKERAESEPSLRELPINSSLVWKADKEHSVRYEPIENSKEIGDIYIPDEFELEPSHMSPLRIKIKWIF